MARPKGSKREEKVPEKEGDYEFELPEFDEGAFIRREVATARASFYTLGLGVAAGLVALLLLWADLAWSLGWLPILGAMVFLGPILKWAGFSEDVVKPKALVGSYFMLFFTALGLWIFGSNFV